MMAIVIAENKVPYTIHGLSLSVSKLVKKTFCNENVCLNKTVAVKTNVWLRALL